jgi:hypothetical protein
MQNNVALMTYLAKLQSARNKLIEFVKFLDADYQVNWHHELLCEYLDRFVSGDIKKLMVFMPPQHGKSRLVSESLPAYILGKNPKAKIVGASYSADLSRKFNRSVQRLMDNEKYENIFANTKLNSTNVSTDLKRGVLRNADIFEIVDYYGFYKSVGVGGSLTGTPCDFGIIDDPVKDSIQATSPTYQARVWNWYNDVFFTRLHNDSRILLTMTRWDKNDLAGKILEKNNDWTVLLLEGIKQKYSHPKDPREIGEALWEKRHSKEKILNVENNSQRTFKALYQQDPQKTNKGLVFPNWAIANEYDYQNLKSKAVAFYGLDFGFSSDPLAFIEGFVIGKELFLKEIVYSTQITNTKFIEITKDKVDEYANIYADHSPDRIAEIQKHYKAIRPAKKGANSIMSGILFLQEFNIHICEGSDNLINEFSLYAYKEDNNGEPLPSIMQGKDHAIDAVRYGVVTHLQNPIVPISYATTIKPNKKNGSYGSSI